MARISDTWHNPGSDTKPGSTKDKCFQKGGSESGGAHTGKPGKLWNGTADAVFTNHTGVKAPSRIPANKELVRGYEFKENWGKD